MLANQRKEDVLPTVRRFLAATVILVPLGGLSGTAMGQDEPEPIVFPTGSFVSVENPFAMLEFDDDAVAPTGSEPRRGVAPR